MNCALSRKLCRGNPEFFHRPWAAGAQKLGGALGAGRAGAFREQMLPIANSADAEGLDGLRDLASACFADPLVCCCSPRSGYGTMMLRPFLPRIVRPASLNWPRCQGSWATMLPCRLRRTASEVCMSIPARRAPVGLGGSLPPRCVVPIQLPRVPTLL